MDVSTIIANIGLDNIIEFAPKIKAGISKAKDNMHLVTEYAKTLNLKDNEHLTAILTPVGNEIYIKVVILSEIEKDENFSTEVTAVLYEFQAFEELEKTLSFLPNN
jgi:hypothetical protein